MEFWFMNKGSYNGDKKIPQNGWTKNPFVDVELRDETTSYEAKVEILVGLIALAHKRIGTGVDFCLVFTHAEETAIRAVAETIGSYPTQEALCSWLDQYVCAVYRRQINKIRLPRPEYIPDPKALNEPPRLVVAFMIL